MLIDDMRLALFLFTSSCRCCLHSNLLLYVPYLFEDLDFSKPEATLSQTVDMFTLNGPMPEYLSR